MNPKTRYYDLTSSPVKDDRSNIIAGIEIARDVTEHVQAGEALQEAEEHSINIG